MPLAWPHQTRDVQQADPARIAHTRRHFHVDFGGVNLAPPRVIETGGFSQQTSQSLYRDVALQYVRAPTS